MKKGKQILVTSLLLMLFAIVGAALVGVTFESTADQIADNERLAMLRSLNEIIPKSEYNNDLLNDTLQLEATEQLGHKHPSLAYVARKQNEV
ncbi:MAG TPA: electron transport complex subunit G, partial [Gammaproteobacteria bacterium]